MVRIRKGYAASAEKYEQQARVNTDGVFKHASSSVAVSAEILLRSPRKLCISSVKKYVCRIKVSKKIGELIFKQ